MTTYTLLVSTARTQFREPIGCFGSQTLKEVANACGHADGCWFVDLRTGEDVEMSQTIREMDDQSRLHLELHTPWP